MPRRSFPAVVVVSRRHLYGHRPFDTLTRVIHALMRSYAHWAPTGRGAYPLLRQALKLAPVSASQHTTPFGIALTLDTSTYPDDAMAFGLYELDTLRLIRRILVPGSHFVDGGANIGYFTLHAARFLGGQGRVDSFEPDPLNLTRLKAHLAANHLSVNLHEAALGAAPGTLTLYHPGGQSAEANNHGRASLYQSLAPGGQSFAVPMVRLDEALDGTAPTLIKLDIEGAEVQAVTGMQQLLVSQRPPMLIVEHNEESARAAGGSAGDVFALIEKTNPAYRFYWIGGRLRPVIPAELARTARQGNILATASGLPGARR
jgi:FkbM family methyltransferase